MRPDVALIGTYPRLGVRHGGTSGVASYTANLAHALCERGARVAVIAQEERGEATLAADGDVVVHRRFRRGPRALPAAAAAAAETNARVHHLQFEAFLYGGLPALGGLPAALVRSRRTAPTVATLHQVVDPAAIDRGFTDLHRVRVPPALARVGLGGIQRTISHLADQVVVHEPSFASVVPGAEVIPHGIELAPSIDGAEARAQLSLDGDRLNVLCFGFVAPYKGLENALAAAALATDEVHLVVAGGAHPRLAGRDGYAGTLEHEWQDIATFPGYVPDDEVGAWFAAADLALFPYPRPFSSSGAVALALAYDTPVLMSPALADAMGAPDLSVPIEPISLAAQLRAIAREPRRLGALRAATRQLGIGRAWPAVADAHLALYEEVMDATDPARGRLRPVESG